MKKAKRSDRDNAVLAKAEVDLAKAKEVCIHFDILESLGSLFYRNTTVRMRTCDNTFHRLLPLYSLCCRTF
jgi:hypothetical protein